MHKDGLQLLNLMFRPGETVCISPNQFGYYSIPLEEISTGEITLIPTPESAIKRNIKWEESFERCDTNKLLLVALNPIYGFRNDANCIAFRNFLVEMDFGSNEEQLKYIKSIGLPYSAITFSGNKSLHVLVSLDTDIPNEKIYRKWAEWALAIANMADPNTKNPSRSIRIPGALREPGKLQALVEYKGPTKISDFHRWLQSHPEAEPKEREKHPISDSEAIFEKMPEWIGQALLNGLDPSKGRNKQWFSIACEFALAGFPEDVTMDILAGFFAPERDFKEREWKTAIISGFKHIYGSRK
jgi:hypothetical protein